MEERVGGLEAEGRALEGARLRQRTTFDLEMMRELGYCTGIENYSRHLSRREAGQPAVDAARLLPAGLAAGRRRVAHDDPAGRRHVQERPDAQGDPGRLRVPAAVGARQPAADVRGVRGDRPPGDLHERDARAVRAGAERAGSSSSSSARPASSTRTITVRPTESQIDDLLEEIRGARRARRARAGHDPDQEDGRGPDRLPQGARGQGPVPPQRGRHARAGRDPARPAPRRLRRPGRHQPAARGHRPARGDPRRDPRRRQGGLPAVGLVAHPDDRPGGPEHRRRGDHVRRPGRPNRCGSRSTRPIAGGPIQEAYNIEHGIEPTTIIKGIRDLNERLRAVAESTVVYASERGGEFTRGRPGQGRGARRAGWRPR